MGYDLPHAYPMVNAMGGHDLCRSYDDLAWMAERIVSRNGQAFLSTDVYLQRLGATTAIEYTPSTEYTNTQLPFPTQTVSKITTNDGNGNVAETTYEYSGGFHHIAERRFPGIQQCDRHRPSGTLRANKPSRKRGSIKAMTSRWMSTIPNVPDGYLKGAPYRTKVTDGSGNLYTEITTTYTADDNGQAPFYSPPASIVTDICDGNGCSTTTRTDFTYDIYGNVTREDQYGDTGTSADDRTVFRTFNPNTTAWILGLPTSETIYQGLGHRQPSGPHRFLL